MGAELGRISGPLLAANLLRNEVDLAFENDLLYFKVDGSPDYVGIKTSAPTTDLFVNGTVRSQDLVTTAGGTYTFGNFSIYNNTIQHLSGKIYIQPDQSVDPVIKITGVIQTPGFEINDNNFDAVGINQSITLATTGTGKVIANSNMEVTGDIHATGDITLDGNIILGNETTDAITFDAEVASDILPKKIEGGNFSTEDGVEFITEDDIELLSDNVNLPTYNLGSPTKKWKSITANSVAFNKSRFNDIELYQNSIYSVDTDQDLILSPNGTGSVVVQNLQFSNNVISNVAVSPANIDAASILIRPLGSGVVTIDATSAVTLPIGPTGALQERGQIRFNTTRNRFRGYVPTNQTISLTQLYSVSESTYITPELTENAGDNTFRFVIDNDLEATLTGSSFTTNRFDLGGIRFESNNIAGITADFKFNPTQNTVLGDVFVSENTLGALTTQPLTWNSTGRGYVKFSGNKGMVLPFGTTAERPLTPENGQYRYNTDLSDPLNSESPAIGGEVWSSEQNKWVTMGGGGGLVNEDEAFAGMTAWALVFNL